MFVSYELTRSELMSRTQLKRNTYSRDSSTISAEIRQLPLRVVGLNVHDAHEQYEPLIIEPPYTDKNVGRQCAGWANRHQATDDRIDTELLNRVAFKSSIAGRRYCNLTQEELVEHVYLKLKIRITTKTIMRRMRRLESLGAIRIECRYDRNTRLTTNRYHLPKLKK